MRRVEACPVPTELARSGAGWTPRGELCGNYNIMAKNWQKLYTRPTPVQDAEIPVARPLFYLSRSQVNESIYVPVAGKWQGYYPEKQVNEYFKKLSEKILRNW